MAYSVEQAAHETIRELQLTERWGGQFEMKPHDGQSLLFHHPARFKACASGRRSGKTETLKRHAVLQLPIYNGHPQKIGIAAPTYTRAKEIYQEDLDALIPRHWIKSKRESLNFMEWRTHWNATIRLFGLQKPQVVEGTPWDQFYTDETPDTPRGWIKRHLRPALATKGREGRAWFIGVPDEAGPNQDEYEKIWERGMQWPKNRNYCSFWWPAAEIVSPEEFKELSEDMDEMTFRQEMLGLFVRSGNKAFPSFDPVLHVDDTYAEYSPFLPIDHTWDFGVRPAVSLVAQQYKNSIWIIDEIAVDDSSTDVAAREFISRAHKYGWVLGNGIRIFGDAAGRSPHSNTGQSDYEIIRQEYERFNVEFKNLIDNPGIKDTVNAVRRRLIDRYGRIRIYISSRCKNLIQELKSAPWPDKLKEYHAIAALRYYIYSLSEFGAIQSGVIGQGKAVISTNERISARYTRQMARI